MDEARHLRPHLLPGDVDLAGLQWAQHDGVVHQLLDHTPVPLGCVHEVQVLPKIRAGEGRRHRLQAHQGK